MATPDDDRSAVIQRYYEGLAAQRNRVVLPLTLVTLGAFFLQQILTNFTSALDGSVVKGVSWAYVYAYGLFVLVVVLTALYTRAMDRVERRLRPPHLDEEDGR
ncbi:DUF485 domain-containing protein [Nocardioides sp. WV_118_6]